MVDPKHNPSFEGSWTDERGRVWNRKGKRGRVLEERRIRTLLRREDVPLVVWQSFEATWYDDVAAKLEGAHRATAGVGNDVDVVASEWTATDGRLLLMLERFC